MAEEPFEAHWAADGAITAASFGGFAVLKWVVPRQPPSHCATHACGPKGDGARPFDPGWNTASDLALGVTVGSALGPAVGRQADGGSGLGGSVVVLSEALGVTLLATETVKLLVPRPRPFLAFAGSGRGSARASPDAVASFWSGHSATAFCAAAVGSIDACRAPNPLGCLAPALGLHVLAATTAFGRVLAGKHHVTDVWAGSAVGAAIGAAVAFAHASGRRPGDRTAGQTIAGAQVFMVSAGWVW